MNKRYSPYIKFVNLAVDFLILNAAYVLAFYIKLGGFIPPFFSMIMYVNLAWFCLVLVFKPYRVSRLASSVKVIGNYLVLIFLHALLILVFYVIQISHQYSRELLTIMYSLLTVGLILWKILFVWVLNYFRKIGFNYRNVVIVHRGSNQSGIHSILKDNPHYGYKLVKEFDADQVDEEEINRKLINFCSENDVDEIFYSITSLKYGQMIELVRFSEENFIKFSLIGDYKGFMFRGFEVENFGHLPLLKIISMPLDDYKNRLLKRSFDVLFSLIVIIGIGSWLFPIIAILIKLDSKGPVIFKQKRTGQDNRPFWCFKFRTMYVNDEADKIQATEGDDRITKIGAFLRRTSLDEFLQFFNVLFGSMSVVGPRPHMLAHTRDYNEDLDKFMVRHSIKPGVTGLAQSKGYRGEIRVEADKINRVKLDIFYVRNWSFYFDIVIIIQTLFSLWNQKNKVY